MRLKTILAILLAFPVTVVEAQQYLKEDTACVIMFGPFVDKTDGVTLKTDATTITDIDHATTGIFLSKNGATAAIRHQGVTASVADAYGFMAVTLDTTDTSTPGRLDVLFAKAATYLPVSQRYMVVSANVYDSLYGAAGADVLDVSVTQLGGVAQSATDLKDLADTGYDPSTHKIAGVVLTDTLTTYTSNTPQTGDVYHSVGDHGAGLTAMPWNASWDAEVESESTDALVAINLDHMAKTAVTAWGTDVTKNSIIDYMTSADTDQAFDRSTDSIEALKNLVPAAAASATWASTAAGGWSEGSLGYVVNTNLNATVSSRSTLTQTEVTGGAYNVTNASCVVHSDLGKINGTSIAGTAAYVATAFVNYFNVATPVATAASVNQGADSNTILSKFAFYGSSPYTVKASTDQFLGTAVTEAGGAGRLAAAVSTWGNVASPTVTAADVSPAAALVAIKLDHLLAVADADDVANDSVIAKLASLGATADWSTFVNTTDSLQAIRDRGDAEWITGAGGDAATIAEAVWDLATSGHTDSGTFGAAMAAAGAAGDPWISELPGEYVAGSAGYIIGTFLDTKVSTAGAGPGTITVTKALKTAGGVPIADAAVWICSDAAGATTVAGPLRTDAFGNTTFYLTAGTYYRFARKTGYVFTNPTTLTVVAP